MNLQIEVTVKEVDQQREEVDHKPLKVGDTIQAWWPMSRGGRDGEIRLTYIIFADPETGFYLGNTSGHDDWGRVIMPVIHPTVPSEHLREDYKAFHYIAAYSY